MLSFGKRKVVRSMQEADATELFDRWTRANFNEAEYRDMIFGVMDENYAVFKTDFDFLKSLFDNFVKPCVAMLKRHPFNDVWRIVYSEAKQQFGMKRFYCVHFQTLFDRLRRQGARTLREYNALGAAMKERYPLLDLPGLPPVLPDVETIERSTQYHAMFEHDGTTLTEEEWLILFGSCMLSEDDDADDYTWTNLQKQEGSILYQYYGWKNANITAYERYQKATLLWNMSHNPNIGNEKEIASEMFKRSSPNYLLLHATLDDVVNQMFKPGQKHVSTWFPEVPKAEQAAMLRWIRRKDRQDRVWLRDLKSREDEIKVSAIAKLRAENGIPV